MGEKIRSIYSSSYFHSGSYMVTVISYNGSNDNTPFILRTSSMFLSDIWCLSSQYIRLTPFHDGLIIGRELPKIFPFGIDANISNRSSRYSYLGSIRNKKNDIGCIINHIQNIVYDFLNNTSFGIFTTTFHCFLGILLFLFIRTPSSTAFGTTTECAVSYWLIKYILNVICLFFNFGFIH
jgi:hypothetical protein